MKWLEMAVILSAIATGILAFSESTGTKHRFELISNMDYKYFYFPLNRDVAVLRHGAIAHFSVYYRICAVDLFVARQENWSSRPV